MSCNKVSFYTLFFTHNVQRTEDGFVRFWVDRPANTLDTGSVYPHENYLFLTASAEQPTGRLVIRIPNARIRFDFSTSVPLDSATTLDGGSFPVRDYSLELESPIHPSSAEVQFYYRNVKQVQTYPKRYTFRNRREEEVYIHNIWWPGCTRPDDIVTYTEQRVRQVDWAQSTPLNQEEVPLVSGETIPFTFDAGLEFTPPLPTLSDELDDDPYVVNAISLNFSNLPTGDATVALEDAGLVYSSLSIANNPITLPSDRLDDNMSGTSLYKTGLSLISLVALKESSVLYRTIETLYDLWARVLQNITTETGEAAINPRGKGVLPIELNKEELFYSFPRASDSWSVSWFGLGLVKAIKFFKAGRPDERGHLPANLDLMLKHHAFYVAGLTDPASGVLKQGVTVDGLILSAPDFKAVPIAALFLSEYLTLQYDPFVHERAARLTQLSQTLSYADYTQYEEYDNAEDRVQLNLSLLLWEVQKAKPDSTIFDRLALDQFFDLIPNPELYGAVSLYINAQYNFKTGFPNFSTTAYIETNPDIFISEETPTRPPDLEICSWAILAKYQTPLVSQRPFDLKAYEAHAYQLFAYQLLVQMWPYGNKWTSEAADDYRRGTLGGLLYAQASLLHSWALTFQTLARGLSILDGNGICLDWWYESLGYKRGQLVQDIDLIQEILPRLEVASCSLPAIKRLLKDLYATRSIYIEECTAPPFYWLKGGVYNSSRFNSSNINHLDIALKAGNSIAHQNLGPGFIFPPGATDSGLQPGEGEVFRPWSDFYPQLTIQTFELCPGLLGEMQNASSAGVGLEVVLNNHHGNNEIKDSLFSIQEGLFLDLDQDDIVLEVSVIPDVVQQFCGDVITLTGVPSLPVESVLWEQTGGNPVTILSPTELTTFINRANVDGPFEFRITVTLLDLTASAIGTALTTPTTYLDSFGLARSPESVGQAYNFIVMPTDIEQGFRLTPGTVLTVGFLPPPINSQYVYEYALVRHNAGVYDVVSVTTPDDLKLPGLVFGQTWFVASRFRINGRFFETLSEIILFDTSTPNAYVDNFNAHFGLSTSDVSWSREGLEVLQFNADSDLTDFGSSNVDITYVRLPLEVTDQAGDSDLTDFGQSISDVSFVRLDLSGTTTG